MTKDRTFYDGAAIAVSQSKQDDDTLAQIVILRREDAEGSQVTYFEIVRCAHDDDANVGRTRAVCLASSRLPLRDSISLRSSSSSSRGRPEATISSLSLR